jgi:predicted nucleotidyltransferase
MPTWSSTFSMARDEDRPGSDLDVAIVARSKELEAALHGIWEALAVSVEELGLCPLRDGPQS